MDITPEYKEAATKRPSGTPSDWKRTGKVIIHASKLVDYFCFKFLFIDHREKIEIIQSPKAD